MSALLHKTIAANPAERASPPFLQFGPPIPKRAHSAESTPTWVWKEADENARNRSRRNRNARHAQRYVGLFATRAGQVPLHFRPDRPCPEFPEPMTRKLRNYDRQLKTRRLVP